MRTLFVVFLLCSSFSWAQSKTEVHSNGVCSPAIGGNVNTITVTCTGMDQATAKQMVSLLNALLAKEPDRKVVIARLDSIIETLKKSSADGNTTKKKA